jgi:hypothetical protein
MRKTRVGLLTNKGPQAGRKRKKANPEMEALPLPADLLV